MIGRLMREQARAHRAYLAWTGALLTLTVALATFAALDVVQQSAIHAYATDAHGTEGATTVGFMVGQDVPDAVAADRFEEAFATAEQSGARPTATLELWAVSLTTADGEHSTAWDELGPVVGTRGDMAWDRVLLGGTPPVPGEIAVDAAWAERADVLIGDSVTLAIGEWEGSPRDLGMRTVSGLLLSGLEGRYDLRVAAGVLAWDDAVDLHDQTTLQFSDDAGAPLDLAYVQVATRQPSADIAALGQRSSPWVGDLQEATFQVAGLAAGVLVVGLIGIAMTVGRARAQSRSQWIATARVLGARGHHVAAATLGEIALTGLIAGLAGTAIAASAHGVAWAAFTASHPLALLPPGLTWPGWLLAGAVGFGVVLAAALGALPAFWASRVTPVAALKPVSPVTEAELSRRISPAWIYGLWGALVVVLVVLSQTGEGPGGDGTSPWLGLVWVTAGATAITSVAMLAELNRGIVRGLGSRLRRSMRPWALAAGDALTGHPRQAAVPATVMSVAGLAFGVITVWLSLALWADALMTFEPGNSAFDNPVALPPRLSPGGVNATPLLVAATLTFTMLALASFAAFVASRQATAQDDDARSALGLTARNARIAAAAHFALPLLSGLAVGLALGALLAVGTFRGAVAVDPEGGSVVAGWTWAAQHAGHAVLPLLAVTLVGAATIAIAAAVVASLRPARSLRGGTLQRERQQV